MAEQRPYRIPGSSAQAQLARVKLVAVLSMAAAFIVVNHVTTQHAATVLRHAPWLGEPLFRAPIIGPVYVPWAWIAWWARWHDAHALAPLWALCVREALAPMALIAGIGCGAIAMARRGWLADASDLHGSARWATTRDLKAARLLEARSSGLRKLAERLRVLRPIARKAGVYLGIWKRSLIRDCGPAHVLVFAPTRSGKGVGIVVPTLLRWPQSVLVHDLKGENWALTAGARKRMGQVCLKFAPASADGDSARYNPLAEVRLRTPQEIRDVRNIVQMIVDPDGKGLPDHWSREGSAFLTGMILDQLYTGRDRTLHGLEARLCDPNQPIDDTLQQIMRAEHDPTGAMGWTDSRGIPTKTHPVIARAMRSMLDKSDNERSGVISEVKGFLELYRDPVIAANTTVSDFRITDLMNHERPVSLYVVVPLAHKNSLRPLIRLMVSQILHRLTEHLEFREGRAVTTYRHRLLLMIDEFPSLGRLDMFAESLSLIAGYGIKACLIAQDLSQIHAAYGHDEAITSNCDTRVAFTPNRIETARLLSQMTGETTVRHAHRTISSSGTSVSEPEIARPLLTPDEAMRLGSNEALIFASGRPAIRAMKLRYYADAEFKLLAKIAPPQRSDRLTVTGIPTAPVVSARADAARETDIAEVRVPASPKQSAKRKEQKPRAGEQLSFLRFAVEDEERGGAPPAQAKERLL
ncbi:MAG TPA: type IV secretory system conjugative DNA transfer family protein [Xanthobacteraceae bacterium]|nr:type IV secretory system conjugative DNA transfer family protein [Xanthobacteraceae bacterium]